MPVQNNNRALATISALSGYNRQVVASTRPDTNPKSNLSLVFSFIFY